MPKPEELFDGLNALAALAGVDVKQELAQRCIHKFRFFERYEDIHQFAVDAGLDEEQPFHLVWAAKEDDNYDVVWTQVEPKSLKDPISLESLLETVADIQAGYSDRPNDFQVNLVLRVQDNQQLAIRYKSEEVDLESLHPSEEERDTEVVASYEAVLCDDYKELYWYSGDLVKGS